MEKEEKCLLVNNNPSVRRSESFFKRWGILNVCDKSVLKNRCLSYISTILDTAYMHECEYIEREYSFLNGLCMELSLMLGFNYCDEMYFNFSERKLYKYLNQLNLEDYQDYVKFMFFL